MTPKRAAVLAALLAAVVYATALGNRFALDDSPIVERNGAAHTVGAALDAFGRTYWPPEHQAGLWRPLVILSFAADWELSDGNPAWLHATNVLWHAAATALLVPVLAPYATTVGALGGALVFAVHPVHVEAVANLVGRAEMMVAVWLFCALLLAREVRRRRAAGLDTWSREIALLAAVSLALLSKEHAAVAALLLALDDLASRRPGERALPWRDYAGVVALTLAWLVARRQVEAGQSFAAIAPTFFHLGPIGRVSTMLPVVFVLVRLFVFPFDLSPDYHPRVVERLEHPSALAIAGLLLLVSFVALAFATWRRHRTVSAGLFAIGLAWLPTANLLFPVGIVLAERTLYLPSLGLALLVAAGVDAVVARHGRQVATLALAVLLLPLAWRTLTRSPDWKNNRDLVLAALANHPESYKVHAAAARVLRRLGNLDAALREYRVADELYPLDHYLVVETAGAELDRGNPRAALALLRRAERLDSNLSLTEQLLANALLETDSAAEALPHAARAVALDSIRSGPARMLASSYVALGMRDSAIAVWRSFGRRGGSRFERWLLAASTFAAVGMPDSGWAAFDSATVGAPTDSTSRLQIRAVRRALRAGPRGPPLR